MKGILRKALNDAFRHICCCFISCTGTAVYREIFPPILILPLLVGEFLRLGEFKYQIIFLLTHLRLGEFKKLFTSEERQK